ncbi:hypothetical protein CBA19C6_22480 [Cupriavidus pauculus]|nr:hypothetical protein CBA19C6_22480 [Cupriavidus pauculus]
MLSTLNVQSRLFDPMSLPTTRSQPDMRRSLSLSNV